MRSLNNFGSLFQYLYKLLVLYPTPIILSYLWNFGSLAGVALMLQIITGIGLSFWYIPSVDLAFYSVEFIMREVNGGWWLRYLHANGASMFFVIVYIHIGRGIFYGSYMDPCHKAWFTGVIIFLVMIGTAFLGYILPWGQMSYWAAMVITSLLSVIPGVGSEILTYAWGGVSIDQPTLTRVYGLHFFLPFVLVGLVALHISFVHESGSTTPLGFIVKRKVPFHPYYTYKDLLGILVALTGYIFVVANFPNLLLHFDNYIPADPGVTPAHIVPEWYFLPFYGILRSVPSKIGGVLLLLIAFVTVFFLPYLNKPYVRSGMFRPVFRVGFELFVVVWLLLGWSGSKPIEEPYYEICQFSTVLFFFFFLGFNQFATHLEGWVWLTHTLERLEEEQRKKGGVVVKRLALEVRRERRRERGRAKFYKLTSKGGMGGGVHLK